MQSSTATLENYIDIPQKVWNRATIWSKTISPGYIIKRSYISICLGDMGMPMIIAALFIIDMKCQLFKCPSNYE
jgi:hypothetical protein